MIWRMLCHREQSLELRSFVSSVAIRDSNPDWTEPQAGAERHTRQQSRKRTRDLEDAILYANDDNGHRSHTTKRQRLTTPPPILALVQSPATLGFPCKKVRLLRHLTPPPEIRQQIKQLLFYTPSCVLLLVDCADPDPSCLNLLFYQQCQRRPTSRSELLALARSSIKFSGYSRAFEQY